VAINLAENYHGSEKMIFIVADSLKDFPCSNKCIKVIALNHLVWGRGLRPLYELLINLMLLFGVFRIHINLSHYGLCLFGRHVIYVHNLDTVAKNPELGYSEGQINWFKIFCFKTCLRKAESIYVQTKHMSDRVKILLSEQRQPEERCHTLTPKIKVPNVGFRGRFFDFQFFYPASMFKHKRTDLAMQSAKEFVKYKPSGGLVITADTPNTEGLRGLGSTAYLETMQHLKSSSALLFTSTKESLALPLYEAMQYGLPAVLPDLEYARDVYGDAGVYYTKDDPNSVCEAMIQLYESYDSYVSKVMIRRSEIAVRSVAWAGHWDRFLNNNI